MPVPVGYTQMVHPNKTIRPYRMRFFFSKIDILSAKVYRKKFPNFEVVWPTPGMLRPLTIKGVYLVSHRLVCASFRDGGIYNFYFILKE